MTSPAHDAAGTRLDADTLVQFVESIFSASGSNAHESQRMAHYLVEANLAGHDSHGVIRVSYYIGYVRNGQVIPNQRASVEFSNQNFLVVDGGGGFGQVVAEEAMQQAIAMCDQAGVAVLALRNCGHLGRIGDWPMMAARAGKVSLHFVNTSGFGLLVAPFGGVERRLSANPIAAGIPRAGEEPIVLDISTCAIAEGKIKVARNRGASVPSGCLINAQGEPTTDPHEFYADPPGAILPFGGHKGYGLGIVAEILAGAVAGSGCSTPGAERLINGMLAIVVDPEFIPREFPFADEVRQFVEFVKSSRTTAPGGEILVPGELEARTHAERSASGIPLDPQTVAELSEVAASLNVACPW